MSDLRTKLTAEACRKMAIFFSGINCIKFFFIHISFLILRHIADFNSFKHQKLNEHLPKEHKVRICYFLCQHYNNNCKMNWYTFCADHIKQLNESWMISYGLMKIYKLWYRSMHFERSSQGMDIRAWSGLAQFLQKKEFIWLFTCLCSAQKASSV